MTDVTTKGVDEMVASVRFDLTGDQMRRMIEVDEQLLRDLLSAVTRERGELADLLKYRTITDDMVERAARELVDAYWPGATLELLNEPNQQACIALARRALTAALVPSAPAALAAEARDGP